jgi:hypothetical protein
MHQLKIEKYVSPSFWRMILRFTIVPLILLILLEFIWYALEMVLDPTIVALVLYLVKFLILGLIGFCITRHHDMDVIGSALTSAVTYLLAMIVEWFIIAPLFYPGLGFYLPGLSVIRALILGALCGFIGHFVAMSDYAEAIESVIPICNRLSGQTTSSAVSGTVRTAKESIEGIDPDGEDLPIGGVEGYLDDLEEHGQTEDE